jgi:hypothetical protein
MVRDIDDDKNARKNAILLSNDNSGLKHLEDTPLQRMGRFDEEKIKEEEINIEPQHDYRLKPNLFEDRLLATVTLKTDEKGKLEIYSLQGVLVGKVALNEGKNDLDLTPFNLSNGVYVYRVWTHNDLKHTDKLVKLK